MNEYYDAILENMTSYNRILGISMFWANDLRKYLYILLRFKLFSLFGVGACLFLSCNKWLFYTSIHFTDQYILNVKLKKWHILRVGYLNQ